MTNYKTTDEIVFDMVKTDEIKQWLSKEEHEIILEKLEFELKLLKQINLNNEVKHYKNIQTFREKIKEMKLSIVLKVLDEYFGEQK